MTPTPPREDIARLAEHVRRRREELALTAAQVHARGGPAPNVLSRIENQRVQALDRSTYRKLDAGLDWEPGSAKSTAQEGGEPRAVKAAVATMATGLVSTTLEIDGEVFVVVSRAPVEGAREARLRDELRRLA